MSNTTGVRYRSKGFLQAYGGAWSAPDEAVFRQFFTVDAVYVESATETWYRGLDQIIRFQRFMFAFSSDSSIEFTSITGDATSFATEWVWSGHATGPLLVNDVQYPATNRPYRVEGVGFCRATPDGLVTYHRDYYDMRHLIRQVGQDENWRPGFGNSRKNDPPVGSEQ